MSLAVAWRAFWSALTYQEVSNRIERVLVGELFDDYESSSHESNESSPERSPSHSCGRSEAVELLAALQRDARFIDFIKEDLSSCDDATVGCVARRVQGQVSATLERWFAIRPLAEACEGDLVALDVESARNACRVRMTGEPTPGCDSVSGRLEHCGWTATKVVEPVWSGASEDALVLAPMELNLE